MGYRLLPVVSETLPYLLLYLKYGMNFERYCTGYSYALINRARGPYEEIFVLGPRDLNVRTNISHMDQISVNKSFIVYLHKLK